MFTYLCFGWLVGYDPSPMHWPRLSFYIQARAEALRDRIVDFQGNRVGVVADWLLLVNDG